MIGEREKRKLKGGPQWSISHAVCSSTCGEFGFNLSPVLTRRGRTIHPARNLPVTLLPSPEPNKSSGAEACLDRPRAELTARRKKLPPMNTPGLETEVFEASLCEMEFHFDFRRRRLSCQQLRRTCANVQTFYPSLLPASDANGASQSLEQTGN